MLSSMRKSAGGVFAKLLILLLVASFAVWGIGDMVRGGGASHVAKIDREVVSAQEFYRALQVLQANLGEAYTPQALHESQFPRLLLNELIDRKVLLLTAKELGLRLDSEAMLRFIVNSPAFKNEKGEFDKRRFALILSNSGLSEQAYLEQTREGLIINLLQDTALLHNAAPQGLAEALFKATHEQRGADLFLVDPLAMKINHEPEESEIETLYSELGANYATPEQRKFTLLTFSPEALKQSFGDSITDEQVNDYYENNIDQFTTPEQRDVLQILFEDKASADAFYAELTESKSPAGLIRERGGKAQKFSKDSLGDALSNEVFSLEKGSYSTPLESDFGWQVIFLTSIQDKKIESLESLEKSIINKIISEQLDSYIYTQSNDLEDALAAGSTLGELQSTLGFETVLQSYDTAKGKRAEPVIMEALAPLLQGDNSGLKLVEGETYFIAQIDEVTPSTIPPLAELEGDLRKEWKRRTQRRLAREQATELASQLQAEGEYNIDAPVTKTFSGQLKRNDNSVSNNSLLKDKILTQGFTRALFALTEGEYTGAYPLPSGEYVVGHLKQITPAPAADSAAAKEPLTAIQKQLAADVPNEIYALWMQKLRSQYDISINEAAIDALLNR